MKFVSTIAGCVLCIVFFGFALENVQEVELQFFHKYELRGPLVLLLLGAFVAGASLGVLALTPTVFRHRREASRQKIAIRTLQTVSTQDSAAQQPANVHTQQ